MANLVLGVGTSHGPSIQTVPEKWAKLGEKDTRDPRFNYQELLRTAKPGLDREITLEVHRTRHAAARTALRKLTDIIAQAKPDVMVVISNLHSPKRVDSRPVFGILRAEKFAIARMSDTFFDPGAAALLKSESRAPVEIVDEKPGHPGLANHLIESLIDDGFDIACSDRLADGVALDDAFSFPYEWILGGAALPIVPFFLSRDLPNQATATRCYDLGKALRRQIERWPGDARVGLIASGGLSHQVVDEELDRQVITALTEGDADVLRSLPRARLNRAPGTPEILNWVTVAAAMAPSRMQLVDYLPCYRSLAGTGHGVTFGYWA
jgi:3-O-methylgallate 3,4-dioxygenase